MPQTDTDLGWSAKSEYLLGADLLFGVLNGGIDSRYIIPQKLYNGGAFPTTGEMVMNGLYIGDDANGNARYLMCDVSTNADLNIAYVLGFQENTSSYVNFLVSETMVGGSVGRPRFFTYTYGDQNVSYTLNSYITSLNNATGMYFLNVGGNPWAANPVWGPVNYPSPNDVGYGIVISSLLLPGTDCYKLNPGWAVTCFASWWTPAGTHLISPILISTIETAVVLSTDGDNPATQTAVNFRYDGMTFYMSLLPGFDADVYTAGSTVYPVLQLEQFGAALPEKLFNLLASEDFANILVLETVDPYDPFGHTGEDAGEVDPDPDDDDIEEDPLPTISFADAGFCRIYSPSLVQLDSLSNYLWTDQTFLQTVINHLKQIIENPIDAIISLSLVPCVPPTSSNEEVKVMFIPTGVYMPPVTNQFVEVDCGTFALKEMYGSALDYNPYTSVQLYLPYVGIVQLDTDEVMGKIIHVGYRIDVVTGVCCAYVKAGSDVLYQFSGHCSIQQPITSADFSGYINAALAAGKLVASIAAAGAGAPEVAASLVGAPSPSVSSTSSDTRTTERNEATGRQITAGTTHRETKTEQSGASFGEVAARGISNTVGAVMNSKTIVQHSGGFSGNSGYLAAVRRPYLIVTRPRIANPEQYAQFNGRPSMIYMNLGSCTGYTQVQSVHLTGIDATNPELSEIATLLTSGVIF